MTISIATMYEALMTRLLSMDPSSVEARRLYVKAFYPGRHKAHGWGFLPRRLLTVGGGARVAKPGVTVHETTPVARRALALILGERVRHPVIRWPPAGLCASPGGCLAQIPNSWEFGVTDAGKSSTGRAPEQRDELALSHSITSSARVRSAAGTVMPSALAVFILMTSWKRVGCSTGKSAGWAPLRILSTYTAAL